MKKMLTIGTAGAVVIGAAVLAIGTMSADADGITLRDDDPKIVAQGAAIYDANCADCHGAQLEGEPNWRMRGPDGRLPAPPHDASGHTWHHDSNTLFQLTKLGPAALIGDPNYASNMPAYEGVLSDAEIVAVLSYIKSTWPQRIRRQHDEMEKRQ